jgi:hypothetical protein
VGASCYPRNAVCQQSGAEGEKFDPTSVPGFGPFGRVVRRELAPLSTWINPDGQCHRLSEPRLSQKGYTGYTSKEFESHSQKINLSFTKDYSTIHKNFKNKRGAFEFWLPMKRRAPTEGSKD